MTIIPTQAEIQGIDNAIPLARYAAIIGYWECSFFGVAREGAPQLCRSVWSKQDRDTIAQYLAEAQEEIEAELGFPLGVRWFADIQQRYTLPLTTKNGYVIQGGAKATDTIAADSPVNHATDPAVIGPVATTVTSEDEIRIFYPASLVDHEVEISPSDISISGGNVTIEIPRCRMVHPDYVDNDKSGIDYTNLANFLAVVDIKQVYNDPATNATLVYPHQDCSTSLCECSCSEYTQTGCIYVKSSRIGILDVLPATYSGGSWSNVSSACSGKPSYVRLNYQAGVSLYGSNAWRKARQVETAVVRLAHSKMPAEPCACEVVSLLWERDRNIPTVVTRERINCPFGLSDGAWTAWRFVQTMKLRRGSTL